MAQIEIDFKQFIGQLTQVFRSQPLSKRIDGIQPAKSGAEINREVVCQELINKIGDLLLDLNNSLTYKTLRGPLDDKQVGGLRDFYHFFTLIDVESHIGRSPTIKARPMDANKVRSFIEK